MSPERFRQIEELYHAVRAAPPGEKAALLARADVEIRHEVESLLSDSGAGDFLERPALADAAELLPASMFAIAPGACLGPYRLESKLGEGGMGEVFRAVDTRLGRAVAIKVSLAEFSAGFEREARAIASLNHPNICQLYDVGANYLVMELVEGPTLADRIKAGALPVEKALAIARQIGEALDAAHQRGVIHRDLKPANIKVTPDGTVKVLDFGIAKFTGDQALAGEARATPADETGPGQIKGTAAYMSPEQARGRAVDKRADIWAFGVVLYEMLTGRRLFPGETSSDTLASVLTLEPDWERVPVSSRLLLKSCLEKEPSQRLRDIADAWKLPDAVPERKVGTRLAWVAAAVLAATTALALWAPWRKAESRVELPSPRFDIDLGADVALAGDTGPAMALSPDGTRLVFVSQDQDGVPRLFHRRLEQPKATLLLGTEGAKQPFFSPDGQWVGFFASGKLRKTRIDGGEPVSLCDAPSGRGASWGEDGNIVASLNGASGLSLIPSAGNNPVALTELGTGEASHRWPFVLPGAQSVVFVVSRAVNNYDEADITLLSLADRSRKKLLEHAGMYPRYLQSGHLAYVTKGSLFAVPFDVARARLGGSAARLGEVAADVPIGYAQVDFSASGMCVLWPQGQTFNRPQWLDDAGNAESLGLEAGRYHYLRLSPDGNKLAYVLTEGPNSDLFVYDWQRRIKTRLTNGRVTSGPVWSPDGRFLVFESVGGIFAVPADGDGTPGQLIRGDHRLTPETFSPDGRLIYVERGELRVASAASEGGQLRVGSSQPLFKTLRRIQFPDFSPDGRWLAYSNSQSGHYEVYVRAYPDNGQQVQVSDAGGIMPFWSQTGHELFYRTVDQRIKAATYRVQGEVFIPETPRSWYSNKIADVGNNRNLDRAVEGKRFVVLMPAEVGDARESRRHVTVIANYFDEVRRRVAGQVK